MAVEYRYAENHFDRLPVLAADLVHRRVAVIVASSGEAALAAKAATTTIPIVFSRGGDPVASGLVASLNRPGANITGVVNLSGELAPKRLQLLRQLMPNASVFGVLADPTATQSVITDLQAAARILDLQLIVAYARTDSDLEPAFATFSQQRVGAVLVGSSVQDPTGKIVAIQATFLTRRGCKALVAVPRIAIGALGAGAVRFGKPEDVLGLAEGIETALSAQQLTRVPTWACLGASRMHRVAIPDHVRELHLFGDNDGAGRDAVQRAAYENRKRRAVLRFPPDSHKDWNGFAKFIRS